MHKYKLTSPKHKRKAWTCTSSCEIKLCTATHSNSAASARSLHRPFPEPQSLVRNFSRRLAMSSFISSVLKNQQHSFITSIHLVWKILI